MLVAKQLFWLRPFKLAIVLPANKNDVAKAEKSLGRIRNF